MALRRSTVMPSRPTTAALAGLCLAVVQVACLGRTAGSGGGGQVFDAADVAKTFDSGGDTAKPADALAADDAGQTTDSGLADSVAPVDLGPNGGPPDTGTKDFGQSESGPTDSGPPDTGPDVPPLGPQTIAQIQQNPASVTCPDATKIVNTATHKGVSVNGVVVASPVYYFKSGTKELEGVYVQDQGGGPWSGAYVIADKAEGKLTGLKAGDVVNLVADVKEFYCYTELEPKIKVQPTALGPQVPEAYTVDLSVLGAAKQAGHEQFEGVMVQIEGVVSNPLADIGVDGKPHAVALGKTDSEQTVLVGPGFGLYPQTKEGQPNYQKGQKLKVVGFWDFSFGKFKITPLSISVQ